MCFLWMVIWQRKNQLQEGMAFLRLSPQHALTGSSGCQWYPERVLLMKTVPWTLSHASAERMNHLFGELSSSSWTGAILSESISNSTHNSHRHCTAPWQRTDFEIHYLSGDCQIFVSWWIIDIRKCLQLPAYESLWGAPEPAISFRHTQFLAGRCLHLGQFQWVMLVGKA